MSMSRFVSAEAFQEIILCGDWNLFSTRRMELDFQSNSINMWGLDAKTLIFNHDERCMVPLAA